MSEPEETAGPALAAEATVMPEPGVWVRLANAQTTSAGPGVPGLAVQLPAEEARLLIRDGLAVRA